MRPSRTARWCWPSAAAIAARAHLHHGGRPGAARRRRLRRPIGARDAAAHRQPGGGGEPGRHALHAVGFENHSGQTYLGPSSRWRGRAPGRRQQRRGRYRGAVYKDAYGCYLHGSLLPKNPWLADRLLARALRRRRQARCPRAARRHARGAGARRRRQPGAEAGHRAQRGSETGDVPPRPQAGGGLAGGDGRLRGEPAARPGPQRGSRPAVRDRARV